MTEMGNAFLGWLRSKNAKEKFIDDLANHGDNSSSFDGFDAYCKNNEDEFVNWAFTWGETPNSALWETLNEEWKKLVVNETQGYIIEKYSADTPFRIKKKQIKLFG